MMHKFTIAVSANYDSTTHRWHTWRTYTLFYNAADPDICLHTIHARRKSEARRLAIAECKRHRKSIEITQEKAAL